MKLIRLKKGQNDFAITNISIGMIMAIERALGTYLKEVDLGESNILAAEFYHKLGSYKVRDIECFGEDLCDKVKPIRH